MQIICAKCGENMTEATRYWEPGIHFYECLECGETIIIVNLPEDRCLERADYEYERAGDR